MEKKPRFWAKALVCCPFETTLVQEWASKLMDPSFPLDQALEEAREAAVLLYGGWGQTKVVEDDCHCLRS
eukprot:11159527-Lingulodinium_polyedra.AAC.1